MDLRIVLNFRSALPLLLFVFVAISTPAQAPNIQMTVSPASTFLGQDLTYTIRVQSSERVPAGVLDSLPQGVTFVSVTHSGANTTTDKCTKKVGFVPARASIPLTFFYGTSVECLVPFPTVETITIVVATTQAGVITNTAALVWEQSGQIKTAKATATALVSPPTPIFANFGPAEPCPAGTPDNCINQNLLAIDGPNQNFEPPPFPPETAAVGFTPAATLKLFDIQVPFGWAAGTNSFDVWITADNAGVPGTVLESFTVTNFPSHTLPPFTTVTTIPSVQHPTLTAGVQYWLVIGPGAADTFGSWNFSWFDMPGPNNFLTSSPATVGVMPIPPAQWFSAFGFNPLRPAFQIDGTP